MNIFSDQRGILSSFNGPYQPRAPRLFEPINNNTPSAPNARDGHRDSTTQQYDAMKCGACGIFVGNGTSQAPIGITWRLGKALCLACAEKEKKGLDGGCKRIPDDIQRASNPSDAKVGHLRVANGGLQPAVQSHSSPLESDGPETGLWERRSPTVWRKDGHEIIRGDNGWSAWHKTSGYMRNGGDKIEVFISWQAIDALLFPQREFQVGDIVECLPDDDWNKIGCPNGHYRIGEVRIGNITINHLRFVTLPDQHDYVKCDMWPVRSLKLIKAVEDK